ncbi:flagellar assembly factor FliW [Firmicutes bacterium CAG:882]|nr:flagellar assembly factor FliW [Firmicutes bacterium CAG:882]
MKVNTRLFGEIDVAEDRIINFTTGIMGFEEYVHYTLIFNAEKKGSIMWLQSLDEPELAFTVMDPMKIVPEYNPVVEDEWLAPLGEVETEDDYFLLSVVTVPSDLTKMTANLKAPIVINMKTMKACQIIVNNDDYQVRYNVYDCVKKMKEGAGC